VGSHRRPELATSAVERMEKGGRMKQLFSCPVQDVYFYGAAIRSSAPGLAEALRMLGWIYIAFTFTAILASRR
jgi:hypothetical protein